MLIVFKALSGSPTPLFCLLQILTVCVNSHNFWDTLTSFGWDLPRTTVTEHCPSCSIQSWMKHQQFLAKWGVRLVLSAHRGEEGKQWKKYHFYFPHIMATYFSAPQVSNCALKNILKGVKLGWACLSSLFNMYQTAGNTLVSHWQVPEKDIGFNWLYRFDWC